MSTIAYAEMTNKRAESAPGTSKTTGRPGLGTYVDALAALVPAEVLTVHALLLQVTTKTTQKNDLASVEAGKATIESVTTILPGAVGDLRLAFWALVAMAIALYVVPRLVDGKDWDRWDWVRACLAPLAFVAWTMLQPTSVFDAVVLDMAPVSRTVRALLLGAAIVGVATGLAMKADAKPERAGGGGQQV